MSDLFACRKCHAIYVITRLPQPPNAPPSCEVCGSKFPSCELGEWLTYQRAEPEWTVNEWLTSAPEVQENVGQADGLSSNGHQAVAEVEDQTAKTVSKGLSRRLADYARRAGKQASCQH